jgi:hypothetical protein
MNNRRHQSTQAEHSALARHTSGELEALAHHTLLTEVDFKWLMAGQGCWIDPVRMRLDAMYAHDCLRSALASNCEALRRCAARFQMALNLVSA